MRSNIIIETEKMKKHGLWLEAYVFLKLLQNAMLDTERVSAKKFKDIVREHGVEDPSELFNKLRKMKLVQMYKVDKLPNHRFVRVTETWTGKQMSLSDSFMELWNKYDLKTNKENAKTMYRRAIKVGVTHDELMKHLDRYLKYLETTDQFKMHCSTWLNPTNKRYEDEYVIQIKKNDREANFKTNELTEDRPSTR